MNPQPESNPYEAEAEPFISARSRFYILLGRLALDPRVSKEAKACGDFPTTYNLYRLLRKLHMYKDLKQFIEKLNPEELVRLGVVR